MPAIAEKYLEYVNTYELHEGQTGKRAKSRFPSFYMFFPNAFGSSESESSEYCQRD